MSFKFTVQINFESEVAHFSGRELIVKTEGVLWDYCQRWPLSNITFYTFQLNYIKSKVNIQNLSHSKYILLDILKLFIFIIELSLKYYTMVYVVYIAPFLLQWWHTDIFWGQAGYLLDGKWKTVYSSGHFPPDRFKKKKTFYIARE